MKTSAIVELKEELKGRDAARQAHYITNMQAIGGDYESRRMEGLWKDYNSLTDKTVPGDREMYEFKLNLLPSLIEAHSKFLSTVPDLRCPPARAYDEAARTLAEKLERVLLGHWQYSNIGRSMNQLGYFGPALGTTIGLEWPDVENHRPVMQMRSPYGFYPVVRDVDGFDLSQAIFNTKYKRRQAEAMYPGLELGTGDDIEVTQYLDEDEIVTIVADKHRVNRIKNKWGFVPIVMIANKTFGEGPWGDADIENDIPLLAELNYSLTLRNMLMREAIMQPLEIVGGENLPEEIPMGPRDAISVVIGGSVKRVAPVMVPFQSMQSDADLIKLIDRVGGVPDVMRSQFEGSIATGRGISALLGPAMLALQAKGNEIYPAIATLNKMAMRMWHAMWPDEEHTVYAAYKNGSTIVETFRTSEFQGYYENIVSVDASSYFDVQSKFMMNLQAVQNRLKSRQLAAGETPGVDDAVADQAQVAKELQEDMDRQAANEARAQQNIQPPMGEQGATNAMLEKGFMGETPPPVPTGGFEAPPLESPEETALEEGTLLQDLIEFFGLIPLKGKVWLAGDIVTDPNYSPQSPNWNKIEVFLEKPVDKSAINAKMRDEFPELHGNIAYRTGAPSEEEPSILVFDPAGEEEFNPEEMMGPEATMGPEAMMGGQLGSQETPPGLGPEVQGPQG